MSNLFGRSTKANLPTAKKGDGAYIMDQNGKSYLDCGDAAVSCLGHSNAHVINAISEQIHNIAFAHTGFFTSDSAENLATKLTSLAPGNLDYLYLVSGGSEAVEAAIKLARQYFYEKGEKERYHVIARKQSYHGNTIGALSSGGNEWRRQQFGPLLIETSHISAVYEYRLRKAGESLDEYGLRMANELEAEILRVGAEKVMAFIAEPVVGATSGALTAPKTYFPRIREICDQYGILLIFDEVMCGMGRTGTLFACEQEKTVPDILTVAKGLGAGYQPIGGLLCTDEIFNTIRDGSGFFQHGHTYMGHPTAAAASLAVIEEIENRNLLERVQHLGGLLEEKLRARFGQHPHIGDIRGRGLFWAVEFVQDRESKTPFDPSIGVNKKLKAAAFDEGLICYPMGGTLDGKHGDHVLLAPPFILEDSQIDELLDKLDRAIQTVFA